MVKIWSIVVHRTVHFFATFDLKIDAFFQKKCPCNETDSYANYCCTYLKTAIAKITTHSTLKMKDSIWNFFKNQLIFEILLTSQFSPRYLEHHCMQHFHTILSFWNFACELQFFFPFCQGNDLFFWRKKVKKICIEMSLIVILLLFFFSDKSWRKRDFEYFELCSDHKRCWKIHGLSRGKSRITWCYIGRRMEIGNLL